MKLTGESLPTRGQTCPSATLSTKNHTWTNPGLHSEMPATNRLSHGTASCLMLSINGTVTLYVSYRY